MAIYDPVLDSQKMMVNKLVIECEYGRVENEWDEQFIFSLRDQLKHGRKLSIKQTNKLQELWEKY